MTSHEQLKEECGEHVARKLAEVGASVPQPGDRAHVVGASPSTHPQAHPAALAIPAGVGGTIAAGVISVIGGTVEREVFPPVDAALHAIEAAHPGIDLSMLHSALGGLFELLGMPAPPPYAPAPAPAPSPAPSS
jgi:hypothetical protein